VAPGEREQPSGAGGGPRWWSQKSDKRVKVDRLAPAFSALAEAERSEGALRADASGAVSSGLVIETNGTVASFTEIIAKRGIECSRRRTFRECTDGTSCPRQTGKVVGRAAILVLFNQAAISQLLSSGNLGIRTGRVPFF